MSLNSNVEESGWETFQSECECQRNWARTGKSLEGGVNYSCGDNGKRKSRGKNWKNVVKNDSKTERSTTGRGEGKGVKGGRGGRSRDFLPSS